MAKIVIAGAGIVGLSTAFYLSQSGHQIVIVDRGDLQAGTSFGNAGYVSPSHFIPLATPGIVAQGLKWMMSSSSPFYIKPRLDLNLIKWGFTFWKRSGFETMKKNMPVLNEMLQLSRSLTKEMHDQMGHSFSFHETGCLMLFKNAETEKHEAEMAHDAAAFGIETQMLNAQGVQDMEPDVEVNVKGGVYYPIDAHVNPSEMMQALHQYLKNKGVEFMLNTEIVGFEKNTKKITKMITSKGDLVADEFILAAGSWLPDLCNKLEIDLMLQAGKGYSMTFQNIKNNLRHPSILVDHRVAMTPLGTDLRMGGTMEISGLKSPMLIKRAHAIFDAAKYYYPSLPVSFPEENKIWFGYRPLSPDGLPYLGRHTSLTNAIMVGGHAMLGISLAAATGKLVGELIDNAPTSMNIKPFDIER